MPHNMTRKYISIVNSRSLSKIMLIRKCDVTLKIRQENAFPFYFFTKYTSPNCATAVVTNTTPSTLTFLHSNHNTSQTETLTPNVIAAKASNLQTEINTYSYHITSPQHITFKTYSRPLSLLITTTTHLLHIHIWNESPLFLTPIPNREPTSNNSARPRYTAFQPPNT